MNIVIFGAGAVGRGLLAPLFCKAGHAVTFIEKDSHMANDLALRRYLAVLDSPRGDIQLVGPCSAVYNWGRVPAHIVPIDDPAITNVDLIVTAVRVENLREVGEILSTRLPRRTKKNPLPILVCENTPQAADVLRSTAGIHPNVFYRSAIAECVIPEVPRELYELDPLLTYSDPHGYLIIDGHGWQGEQFKSDKIVYSDNFEFDWDLKWYCHCALHLVVALLGLKAGHLFIHEAMWDGKIYAKALDLMSCVKDALSEKHKGTRGQINERIDQEIYRLSKADRPDRCSRVARDLARKLQKGERLLDALALVGGKNAVIEEAMEYGKSVVSGK